MLPSGFVKFLGGKNTDKGYVTVACLFICSFGLIGNSNVL